MTDKLDITMKPNLIALPAGRFHYRSWGAGRSELPSVLLLHGITSSAQSWVRVGPALAEHYRVYALDMRGHGDSIKKGQNISGRRDSLFPTEKCYPSARKRG